MTPFELAYGDGELIPIDVGGTLIESNDEALLAVSESGGFLPRVQLYGGNSDAVKEGKIGVANYGLVRGKDQLEDLGKEVDVLVIAGRVKALDISNTDAIVTSYDHKSDTFKDIAGRSGTQNSGCMFGPEYLIYVPSAKSYATFFLSSPTARREARSIHARLRKAATLKSQLIVGKKFKWHGPVITPCTTPFELPPVEEMTKQAEAFLNPKTTGPELATESKEGEERAR
jgi:hypothetical protein